MRRQQTDRGTVLVPVRTRLFVRLGEVVVSLPSIVLSGWLLVELWARLGYWTTIVVVVWVLASAVYLFFVCSAVIGAADQANRAEPAERERLADAWALVAGDDAARYTLWIKDSDEVGGYAAPLRHICVTCQALAVTSDGELRALLAHEWAHHLLVPPLLRRWISCVRGLFEVPFGLCISFVAAIVLIVVRGCGMIGNRLSGYHPPPADHFRMGATAPTVAYLTVGWALVTVLTPALGSPVAVLVALIVLAQEPARAQLSQQVEFRADRVAVDLGYGADMRAFLRASGAAWEHTHPVHPLPVRLFGTHPTVARRVATIEARERKISRP
ncbi:M48 family metalloprotease [Nocardia sp. NPDC059177]|uniref:M48 family metalloprotease n=1 Tax=Nocardia sp. NPDC059177 TaxID=3346759 RepID=UPI0036848EC8